MRNIHGLLVISKEEERKKCMKFNILNCIRWILFFTVGFLNIAALISGNCAVFVADAIAVIFLLAVMGLSIYLGKKSN